MWMEMGTGMGNVSGMGTGCDQGGQNMDQTLGKKTEEGTKTMTRRKDDET